MKRCRTLPLFATLPEQLCTRICVSIQCFCKLACRKQPHSRLIHFEPAGAIFPLPHCIMPHAFCRPSVRCLLGKFVHREPPPVSLRTAKHPQARPSRGRLRAVIIPVSSWRSQSLCPRPPERNPAERQNPDATVPCCPKSSCCERQQRKAIGEL